MTLPGPISLVYDFVVEERRRGVAGSASRVLVVSSADEARALDPRRGDFDAAWIDLSSLEGLDPEALGSRVAAALRPGSPVGCVVPGAWALPALLERVLLGTGEAVGPARFRADGRSSARESLSGWRRAFGPAFSWRRIRALGVLVPSPASGEGWVRRHPHLFALLAAAEHVVGAWPVMRALGDRILLEGVRR